MIAVLLSASAGAGVFLLYTAKVFGWRTLRMTPLPASARPRRPAIREWLVQAGYSDLRVSEFAGVMTGLFVIGTAVTFAILGTPVAALVVGAFVATSPIASARAQRARRKAAAQEAWPRLIEELRILTSSVGRSIPQGLFEVGRRGPEQLRPAFAAAQREWLISTDFERTIAVLKAHLADPTADAALETLLIAHELGGTDLDRRLEALVEDRILDTQGRKDARAKQAGVRFARRFVLLVPCGMALAGMSVGDGRAAYRSSSGQLLVLVAIGLVVSCWVWAGRVMRLPEEERVFFEQ